MVPKPIVANSSFVTYKYGKNKLGVEVRKNKNAKKDTDSQPIKSKYFPLKPIFENGIDIKYAFAAVTGTHSTDSIVDAVVSSQISFPTHDLERA